MRTDRDYQPIRLTLGREEVLKFNKPFLKISVKDCPFVLSHRLHTLLKRVCLTHWDVNQVT
jgi:hypothetical protein